MLEGHVDEVTPRSVSGWAADDAAPDRTVEVLVLVNGAKIARVACDQFREDLEKTGRLGDGRHGFSYPLDEVISEGAQAVVRVHFAETGLPVGGAGFRLNGAGVVREPVAPVHAAVPSTIPGPRTPREALGLVSLYRPETGLLPLLSRVDLEGRSPASVWYAVFGEAIPADRFEAGWEDTKEARDALHEWLGSEEFQANLIPIALRAFEEKRRVIFVHVPKCGGTHVGAYLGRRLPRLDNVLTQGQWTAQAELLDRLSWFTRVAPLYDSILVTGHVQLTFYAQRQLIRPTDLVFTVVRDPVDMVISQINYVLTRIAADSQAGVFGQDTKEWLQMLDMDAPEGPLSAAFIETAAARAVRHPLMIPKDSLCYWLGDRDVDRAVSHLRVHDVEITDVRRLDAWLQERWGIEPSPRHNESVRYFTRETLPAELMSRMLGSMTRDLRLYGRIASALERTGGLSVRGRTL